MEGGERKDYTELAFLFIFNLPSVVKDPLLMETDLVSFSLGRKFEILVTSESCIIY